MTTDDINITNILHEVGNDINSILEANQYLLRHLKPNPFSGVHNIDSTFVANILQQPVDDFIASIRDFLIGIDNEKEAEDRNVPIQTWKFLKEILCDVENISLKASAVAPFRFRQAASRVLTAIDSLNGLNSHPKINKTKKKVLIERAMELERLVCLFDLHRVINRTESIKNKIYEILQSRKDLGERDIKTEQINLAKIVTEIVEELRDRADHKGIHIRFRDQSSLSIVKVPVTDLKKSLKNLLDNAIKYTGNIPYGSKYNNTWVDIKINSSMNMVSVSIESWGLPITKEEHKGAFVFLPGFRGRFARKLGIEGSGTGLADARNFAIKNGGDLIYDTNPVSKDENLFSAVKTTVTLKLPIDTTA